jgi:X-X-X-Leu-X-X-Gly heptad repeat protein
MLAPRPPSLVRFRPSRRRPAPAWTGAVTFALVSLLAVTGPMVTTAAAQPTCAPHATTSSAVTVTAALADDGEVIGTAAAGIVDGTDCRLDDALARTLDTTGLPVAAALLHRAADGRSLEGSELGQGTEPVRTLLTVRDTTAAEVHVRGAEDADRQVRLGVPQLVRATLRYPASWEVIAPTEPGTAVRVGGDVIEVSRTTLLFPPLTAGELRLTVTATPGRGTPDVRIETRPVRDVADLGVAQELLDPDAVAVLAALAEVTADGGDELDAGTRQLADGTRELADGTGELAAGLEDLAAGVAAFGGGLDELGSGSRALADGSRRLADGTGQLAGGLPALAGGARDLAAGNQQLADEQEAAVADAQAFGAGAAELAGGARALANGLEEASAGVDAFRAQLRPPVEPEPLPAEVLAALPPELVQRLEELAGFQAAAMAYLDGFAAGTDQLATGAAELADGVGQLAAGSEGFAAGLAAAATANRQLAEGGYQLADAIDEVAGGAAELARGNRELAAGLAELAGGTGELAAGAGQLGQGARGAADGGAELSEGTRALAEGAAELAEGAGQLPEAVREIVATADRAGGRSAHTRAVLEAGIARADELTGELDTIAYVLAHDGERPTGLLPWVAAVAALAAAAGGWWWRRHRVGGTTDTEEVAA